MLALLVANIARHRLTLDLDAASCQLQLWISSRALDGCGPAHHSPVVNESASSGSIFVKQNWRLIGCNIIRSSVWSTVACTGAEIDVQSLWLVISGNSVFENYRSMRKLI
jgi:hypothetical protein